MLAFHPCAILLALLLLVQPVLGGPAPPQSKGPPGIVYYTPWAAAGSALELLDTHFALVPIVSWPPKRPFAPTARGVVTHMADLADATLVNVLQMAYDEGLTVAIVDAGTAEVEAFRQIVGRDYPVALDPPEILPLLGLREQSSGDRRISRTHLLRARAITSPGTPEGEAEADAHEADWLRAAFEDLEDEDAPAPGTSPTDCLTELADSILTDTVQSDEHGDSLQCVNTTWSTRSFTQSDDLYYVRQTLTTKVGSETEPNFGGVIFALTCTENTLTDPNTSPVVIQNSPGETQNATQYTSGVSYGLGGSAGYKVDPLLIVSPSMSISDSTTTTVDPTDVGNSVDPSTGVTQWMIATDCGNNCTLDGRSYSYTVNWIWAVPFSSYGASQECVTFESVVSSEYALPTFADMLAFTLQSNIPLPFNETTLAPPTVTSVSPTTAAAGDTITIQGTNFYLIQDVILGGNDVPMANYQVTESNTTLSVDIPAGQPQGAGQSVVVSTQLGLSNSDMTITIN